MYQNHLETLFDSLQEILVTSLRSDRQAHQHPGMKGPASEENWHKTLAHHIPHRYQVGSGKVVDSNGAQSDQIDVLIYDRQYTPVLYNHSRQMWFPAESVYAVFEVKQELNRNHIQYAGEKVASVRRLYRTATRIAQAGGDIDNPKPPFRIMGGILCYESSWKPSFGESLIQALSECSIDERLDLGCAVMNGGFDVSYDTGKPTLKVSDASKALVYFLFRSLGRLQALGTVPAIDYAAYARTLSL